MNRSILYKNVVTRWVLCGVMGSEKLRLLRIDTTFVKDYSHDALFVDNLAAHFNVFFFIIILVGGTMKVLFIIVNTVWASGFIVRRATV